MESIEDTMFSWRTFLMIRRSKLFFPGASWTVVLAFAALETGLKTRCLFKVALGILNSIAELSDTEIRFKNDVCGPHLIIIRLFPSQIPSLGMEG